MLTAAGLTHEQRYVGNTHRVTECVGERHVRISISLVDRAELGFDTSRFSEPGIVAHACAEVSLLRPDVSFSTMAHLARRKAEAENGEVVGAGAGPASRAARDEVGNSNEVDPLVCPSCGGEMRIIACILDHGVGDQILRHLAKTAAQSPRGPPSGEAVSAAS